MTEDLRKVCSACKRLLLLNCFYVDNQKATGRRSRCIECIKAQVNKGMRERSGLAKTRIYRIWANMKTRCLNKHHVAFKDYGGRGIKVCDRWLNSCANFAADMGNPPDGATLDRINNDGDYSPDNCRWATNKEQARNRRSTKTLTIDGVTKSLAEWAESAAVCKGTFYDRIKNTRLSPKEALCLPRIK